MSLFYYLKSIISRRDVTSSVIPDLQVGVLLCFVEILMEFKGLSVVSHFQKCNLVNFVKLYSGVSG